MNTADFFYISVGVAAWIWIGVGVAMIWAGWSVAASVKQTVKRIEENAMKANVAKMALSIAGKLWKRKGGE